MLHIKKKICPKTSDITFEYKGYERADFEMAAKLVLTYLEDTVPKEKLEEIYNEISQKQVSTRGKDHIIYSLVLTKRKLL